MSKRLYRSETDRMLGGVCGGLGEYFGIDPIVIRLVFLLIVIYGGTGILAYLVLWIVVPSRGSTSSESEDVIADNAREIKESVERATKNIRTEVSSDTKKKK